jgi:hypothetical protein
MSMPTPSPSGGPRASRTVKLVLMGVAGAALLYSCAPGVGGAGLGALPYLWLFPNPFFRGPAVVSTPAPGVGTGTATGSTATTTTSPTTSKTAPATTQSQRGGFGSTGSSGSSAGGGAS